MPQATQELSDEWDGPDDSTAIAYLEAKGWVLGRDWIWRRKERPTDIEERAMLFLIQEWDFGGWEFVDGSAEDKAG